MEILTSAVITFLLLFVGLPQVDSFFIQFAVERHYAAVRVLQF